MKNIGLRSTSSFQLEKDYRRYFLLFFVFLISGLLFAYGLLVYNNPVPISSPSFIPIVKRRVVAIIAMLIASLCQSIATVTFQTVTNNKIITPSLLGFEALYSTIHTATLFFFGLSAFLAFQGIKAFLIQITLMIVVASILYGLLLSRKNDNMQMMLLIGVVLGSGLKSASSFMRRILSPSEFDLLQARLFASVNHADPSYFKIAIPIVLVTSILLFLKAKKLNVLSLGKDVCTNLGQDHKNETVYILTLASILMSISTALVGPLTFFGFLVATLTYEFVPSYDHKYILPMSFLIGFAILTASYFFMNHIFSAQGVVSIIIEFFGGISFIAIILRKGSL